MSEDKTYNGWTNYETWNVALWIDNEPGTYETRREMAVQAWEDAETRRGYESQTRQDSAKYLLSERLREWVEEMAPNLGASMFSDLLSAALSEVNWYEIAENWLEEVEKTEEAIDGK